MEQSGVTHGSESVAVERFALETLREAWDAFKTDPVLYIMASLIATAVSVLSLTLLAGPMIVGFIGIIERRRRGESASAGDVFDGFSELGSSVVAFLVVAAAALVGAMLVLGLPLVLFACCFTFHELAYRRAHAIDAIKSSFEIARHNVLHVLLVLVGLTLLNALGGIGVVVWLLTAPFSMVLVTVAYEKLAGHTPERSMVMAQV